MVCNHCSHLEPPFARETQSRDTIKVAASLAIGLSILSIAVCLTALPIVQQEMDAIRDDIEVRLDGFKKQSDSLWSTISAIKAPLIHRGKRQNRFYEEPVGSTVTGIFLREDICQCSTDLAALCPAGPPGTPGQPGLLGLPGPIGDPGKKGLPGTLELPPDVTNRCKVCPGGTPGRMGPMGDRGRPGPKGRPGRPAPPGGKGADGQKGPRGNSGSPGMPGSPGPKGPPGRNGNKGTKGPMGPKGNDGAPGQRGNPGPQGMPSFPGSAGPVGPPGMPGFKGTDGFPGPPGPAGQPGRPGDDAQYCPCPLRRGTLLNGQKVSLRDFEEFMKYIRQRSSVASNAVYQ